MMVILGKLNDLQQQFRSPHFSKVIEYIRSLDKQKIISQFAGKNSFIEEIQGREIYAIFISHQTQDRSKKKYEAHRKYIDVQYILEGEEAMEFRNIDGLEITSPYNEKDDCILFSNSDVGQKIILSTGEAAIFFPEDAHIPGIAVAAEEKVIKVVVKYWTGL